MTPRSPYRCRPKAKRACRGCPLRRELAKLAKRVARLERKRKCIGFQVDNVIGGGLEQDEPTFRIGDL